MSRCLMNEGPGEQVESLWPSEELDPNILNYRKNVTLRTVAYGDNFHITVVKGACVNATVQLQERLQPNAGKQDYPVILWRMKIYRSIFYLGKG
ncbi:hypothetical protein llap_2674 [Limosa lapponica baueri]|uniref:Uncharacterized protein n=1 Tax=Limosa lapponica baueri TaxID=1758121 RepID=A0A2I0ULU8_LIMLA|nr:hypothetical protein llap_2674 [Limosa lapponica baueri]